MKLKHCLLALLVMLIAASCTQDDSARPDSPAEKYVVSLALGGEISATDEPLARSNSTNDLYGINVYYDKEGDGNINDIYGYGLFDNVDDMMIELLSSHKYRFDCTLVKDGKTTLYYGTANNSSYSGYLAPFNLINNSNKPTLLENKFILGTDKYFRSFENGDVRLAGSMSSTSYPSINRFYGKLADYIPTQGSVAMISLKRVVFGAKFIVTGVHGGTLKVDSDFWDFSVTEDYESEERIFTFPNVYDCFNETPITQKITLKYDDDSGSSNDLSLTESVTFKRNTLTTITINVSQKSGISISEESWGEDNLIELEINADGVIDTPVVPNE